MNNLRVSLIQSNLYWEDKIANLNMFSQKIKPLAGQTDVIVLPEMFTTSYIMKPASLAESMEGRTIEWMAQHAQLTGAVVMGSFIVIEGENFYNRLVWMQPDGNFSFYDKKHLFTFAKENEYYVAGKERLIVDYKGWKICPLICYDLRFPVWSRNTVGYDLLIYVASWPTPRANAWKSLLNARAIENQAYTIGVNRVGVDGNDMKYSGDSSLTDFSGKTIYLTSEAEDVFTTTLDYTAQQAFRKKLNFLADQDAFELKGNVQY